ncbi:SDR family NAD(P)-dependent oxidoreductase [Lichenicoccus sp.]|uniref:SDR family NAD(P)-dependent oxidoreductase n=1 Tax=Lichenicoccus sp. TaxID=2781899 RepID=UPI003D0E2B6C
MTWTLDEAPSQAGRLAVITGASGGLGLDTARGLARKGAEVVIAARDPVKGRAAAVEVGGGELQFGTNFLGHYALTKRLLPLLRQAKARVVSISSLAHKNAHIECDDLMSDRRYSPVKAYGLSKMADLLFARELQRKSGTPDGGCCRWPRIPVWP